MHINSYVHTITKRNIRGLLDDKALIFLDMEDYLWYGLWNLIDLFQILAKSVHTFS